MPCPMDKWVMTSGVFSLSKAFGPAGSTRWHGTTCAMREVLRRTIGTIDRNTSAVSDRASQAASNRRAQARIAKRLRSTVAGYS
jgi:hypothetical protein